MSCNRTLGLARCIAICLPAVMFSLPISAATGQPFELDGNARASTEVEGTDWDVVNQAGDSGLTEAETDLIADRPEPTQAIFTGGGSKDEIDVNQWKWRNGSPPAKDDLTNAYAAAVRDKDNHFVLLFGMDRYDTSGDAQLGFWFFQDDVMPIGSGNSGSWDGEHREGDILVLVNFSNGGTVPTIQVFRWNGTTAVQIAAPNAALCTNGWIPDDTDHCGITNEGPVAAPWDYENKDVGPTNTFPPGAFFEGAIDLTELGATACFTSFLAESRSSTSITAVLKDFAGGGFPVCDISVTKECSNPRLNDAQNKIIYDITGKVTNDGFGDVHNVSLSDDPAADGAFQVVNCSNNEPLGTNFPLETLSTEACYLNTITVDLDKNGTSDTVTAAANTAADGTGTALDDKATATCPNLQISPEIEVTKDCKTTVVASSGLVAAKVTVRGKVCNIGDTKLTGVQVDDLNITTTPDPLLSNKTLLAAPVGQQPSVANGACMEYTGTYFPTSPTDSSGNVTNCPASVLFKDTVKATATDIFGAPVAPHTDMAECPLCPGDCPVN